MELTVKMERTPTEQIDESVRKCEAQNERTSERKVRSERRQTT